MPAAAPALEPQSQQQSSLASPHYRTVAGGRHAPCTAPLCDGCVVAGSACMVAACVCMGGVGAAWPEQRGRRGLAYECVCERCGVLITRSEPSLLARVCACV
jgi:hypothetical protein